MLHIPTHPQRILIRNQMADQGFQVRATFADESGVPLELAEYFEPWRLSLVVVSDGTNRLYRLNHGEGWVMHYVRFTEVPADIQITLSDTEDDPIHPGEKTQLNYLAPGALLRSVIITDQIMEQPGINAAFGITTPDGERLWSILSLLPVQTA